MVLAVFPPGELLFFVPSEQVNFDKYPNDLFCSNKEAKMFAYCGQTQFVVREEFSQICNI